MEGWTLTGSRMETWTTRKKDVKPLEVMVGEYLHEPTVCAKCGAVRSPLDTIKECSCHGR